MMSLNTAMTSNMGSSAKIDSRAYVFWRPGQGERLLTAVEAATNAEQIRQRNLERQSTQLFRNNLNKGYGNLPADVDAATKARAAAYSSILPPSASVPDYYAPGTAPDPSIIGKDATSRA